MARARGLGPDDAVTNSNPLVDHAQEQFAIAEALLRSDEPDVIFYVRCLYYAATGLFDRRREDDGRASAKFDMPATIGMLRRQPFRLRLWQACSDAFDTTLVMGPILEQAGVLGDRVYGAHLVERIFRHHSARALALHAALKDIADPLSCDGPALAIGLGYIAAQRIAEAPGSSPHICRPSHHSDLPAVLDDDTVLADRVQGLDPMLRSIFDDAVVHWLHVHHLNAVAQPVPD